MGSNSRPPQPNSAKSTRSNPSGSSNLGLSGPTLTIRDSLILALTSSHAIFLTSLDSSSAFVLPNPTSIPTTSLAATNDQSSGTSRLSSHISFPTAVVAVFAALGGTILIAAMTLFILRFKRLKPAPLPRYATDDVQHGYTGQQARWEPEPKLQPMAESDDPTTSGNVNQSILPDYRSSFPSAVATFISSTSENFEPSLPPFPHPPPYAIPADRRSAKGQRRGRRVTRDGGIRLDLGAGVLDMISRQRSLRSVRTTNTVGTVPSTSASTLLPPYGPHD